jgi:truncated hemoglobin YjbI
MAMALGGPSDYRGPTLRQPHVLMASTDLDDSGFGAFLEHFEDVQQELGLPPEQIAEVMPIFHRARRDVLNRGARQGRHSNEEVFPWDTI